MKNGKRRSALLICLLCFISCGKQQQNNSPNNAGFGAGRSWLPVHADYKTHNVRIQKQNPDSVLNYYKRMIRLRRNSPALLNGKYVPLNNDDVNVVAYVREYAGQSIIIALNMSGQSQTIKLDIGSTAKTLISSSKSQPTIVNLAKLSLEPYQAFVGEATN